MKKENLAIVSNEKTYFNNQNYFCDNIDMKSIPEGLNKNFDIELFARNSKSERSSHKIDLKNNNSLEDKLFNEISNVKLGAVTNVTDHWIMINLKGKKVYELLSTSCPLDFNNFKQNKGSVVQTVFNHIDVIIHHKNSDDLNLFVRRSFFEHLLSWINDAASRI